MTTLDLKKLSSCGSDWELNQYKILIKIKEWLLNFRKNKLFPSIEEAIQLNLALEDLLEENLSIKRISRVEKNYHGKGYFSLPDNKNEVLNIYLYEIIWDWSQENLYQRINSRLVRSVPQQVI